MAAKCYDNNDNENSDYVPCWESTDGEAVPCCYAKGGDSCASNGLCVTSDDDTATPYFINGCTGSGWTNGSISGCPATNCLSTGGNGVKPCGDSHYCCYGFTGCDCDNSTQVFALDPVRIVTSLALTASATGTVTSSVTNTATSSLSLSLSSSSTVTQATASSSSSSGAGSNNAIGLGIGLGLGIPFSLAVAGGLWLLYRSRRGNDAAAASHTVAYQNADGVAGWQGYGYPAMEMSTEAENQPKVELQGNRRVELQARSIPPTELAGDEY